MTDRPRTGRPETNGAADQATLRAVVDRVRTSRGRDTVTSSTKVVDLEEFLAVEAVLNRRWPETKLAPSLDRIAALTDALGNPQQGYPVVHITGTNGKTSVARMIDTLLTELGLRTGRYTSPHLQRATERISLDNEPIRPERYVELYREVEPFVDIVDARRGDGPELSKFEVLTAMAFAAFADAPVEVGVVEVGMGGSWDATNVVDGAVAVITPVDVDHVDYLGADVTGIAREKAGIIKPGAVAVLAEQDPVVAQVLLERATEVGAQVVRAGADFGVRKRELAVGGQRLTLRGLSGEVEDVFLPLHGEHQAHNAAAALAAVEALIGANPEQRLDPDTVRAAFDAVTTPGRLERLAAGTGRPTVLCDSAHNPHGARALARALRSEFRFERLVGVLSVMRDKDVTGMLTALEPVLHEIVITANSSPRAMDPDELAARAVEVFGEDRVIVETRFADAVTQAEDAARRGGDSGVGVVVTGSVVTAGDARTLYGKEPG